MATEQALHRSVATRGWNAMPDTDGVLIDPTEKELKVALAEAAHQANGKAGLRLLRWPPPDLADFLRAWRAAEGFRQWNGGSGTVRSGEARSVVAVAWWTDWIGRKHTRVVGRRGMFNDAARRNLFSPGA